MERQVGRHGHEEAHCNTPAAQRQAHQGIEGSGVGGRRAREVDSIGQIAPEGEAFAVQEGLAAGEGQRACEVPHVADETQQAGGSTTQLRLLRARPTGLAVTHVEGGHTHTLRTSSSSGCGGGCCGSSGGSSSSSSGGSSSSSSGGSASGSSSRSSSSSSSSSTAAAAAAAPAPAAVSGGSGLTR